MLPPALLTILAGLFTLIVTILWLVIGWRAMKAHEDLATNAALIRKQLLELSKARASNIASSAS